ncbi:MAG: ComEC/Rec2 family competence protein, partial [Myxococcota bacterium]
SDRVWLAGPVRGMAPEDAGYLFQGRRWMESRGYGAMMTVKKARGWHVMQTGWGVWSAVDRFRQGRERWAIARLGEEGAALVLALVTGSRGLVSSRQRRPVDTAGLSHLLAISGLHLMAVAWLAHRCKEAWQQRFSAWFRRRRWARMAMELAPLLPVLVYGTLSGWPVSAQRAMAMLMCWGVGQALEQRSALVTSLPVAAGWVLMAESSHALFEAGFLLSVTAVAGLALWGGHQERDGLGLRDEESLDWEGQVGWRAWLWVKLSEGMGATLASNAACLPWMLILFARVPLVGSVLNLVAVPVVSVLALPAGLIAMVFGDTALGRPALTVAHKVMWGVQQGAAWAEAGLGGWSGMGLGLSWPPALMVGVMGAAFMACIGHGRGVVLSIGVGAMVAGLVAVEGPAEVRLLPVGQGDAILVRDGHGRTVLIDAGGSATGEMDPGEQVVRPALRRLGVWRLDVVVVSHGDMDHIGGLPTVIREFEPAEIWWSGPRGRGRGELRVLEAAREVGAVVREPPRRAQLGAMTLRRVDPVDRYGYGAWMERNERSVVYDLELAGVRMLLTGDVEQLGEWRMLGAVRPVHVLKAAHHGSRSSSTKPLLERTAAQLVVIQAGRANRFGHPHPDVVMRYLDQGSLVLSTIACGEVVLRLHGEGRVEVDTWRPCLD